MDTKVLYVTAIAIAAVSGGYYYYSGKGNKLQADSARSMKYSAENINLTQTDEQGKLYIRAQVDRLEQDLQQILEAVGFTDKLIFGRTNYNKEVS